MLLISQPNQRPRTIAIIGGLIIGKRLFDRYMLPGYQVPAKLINKARFVIRKIMRYSIIAGSSLIPLGITLQIQDTNIIVVLDDSLSMQSQDISPTRLEAATYLINGIQQQFTLDHCYSLNGRTGFTCNQFTTLQKSGSSITDLVLIVHANHPNAAILVFSDGGTNNGIQPKQLGQLLTESKPKALVRIDIQPSNQLILQDTTIQNHYISTLFLPGQSYIMLTGVDKNSLDNTTNEQQKTLKNIVSRYHISLNYIIILYILMIACVMSVQHFAEHLSTIQHNKIPNKK